jgi:hypothetical protein
MMRALPAAVAVSFLSVVSAAQGPERALVILSPEPRAVLSGPSTFEADTRPADTQVRRVTFFVDGQPACRAHERPFRCDWDAGSRAEPRTVRVVADLDGAPRARPPDSGTRSCHGRTRSLRAGTRRQPFSDL